MYKFVKLTCNYADEYFVGINFIYKCPKNPFGYVKLKFYMPSVLLYACAYICTKFPLYNIFLH